MWSNVEMKTRKLIKDSHIPEVLYYKVKPQEKVSRVSKLYILLKIHKPDSPLRTIVNAVNSPTLTLKKYLAV